MLRLISGYFLLLCAVALGGLLHSTTDRLVLKNDQATHPVEIGFKGAHEAQLLAAHDANCRLTRTAHEQGGLFLEFFAEEVEEDDDKHTVSWRPSDNGTAINCVCDQSFLRECARKCRDLLMVNARAHNNNTSLQVLEVFRL